VHIGISLQVSTYGMQCMCPSGSVFMSFSSCMHVWRGPVPVWGLGPLPWSYKSLRWNRRLPKRRWRNILPWVFFVGWFVVCTQFSTLVSCILCDQLKQRSLVYLLWVACKGQQNQIKRCGYQSLPRGYFVGIYHFRILSKASNMTILKQT